GALAVASLGEAIFVARSGELALQTVGKNWVLARYAQARRDATRLLRLDLVLNGVLYAATVALALAVARFTELNAAYISALALMIPAQAGYGVYKSLFISTSKLKQ